MRYADDCNIYMGNQATAQRVLASITQWLSQHLRLEVNGEQERNAGGPGNASSWASGSTRPGRSKWPHAAWSGSRTEVQGVVAKLSESEQ